MGCGVFLRKDRQKVFDENYPPNILNSKFNQEPTNNTGYRSSIKKSAKPFSFPDNEKCYLFGINEKMEENILVFDSTTEKFSTHPIPQNLEIWNYSSALLLAPDKILITGGINKSYNEISKKVFMFNPVSNTCTILPLMNQGRYTHMSTFFEDKLYVLGGRAYGSDDVALLSHVEAYDQKNNTWLTIASMNKPRCTGFVCIYRQGIYVFGGYSGPLKRSKKIERYDKKKNQWELLNYKLHRGIECGLLISVKEDEVILIGGQIRTGPTKSVLAYDFSEKTVHFRSKMSNARVLQKGFLYKDILYIFGGDNSSLVEKASVNNWEWSDVPSAIFTSFVGLEHIEKFGHSSPPIYIQSTSKQPKVNKNEKIVLGENLSKQPNSSSDEIFYLFGTDEEPFIMEFNVTRMQVRNLPVPLSLRLYCYQSGVQLTDKEYFICGGIHHQMDQIMKTVYIYSTLTHSANELATMFKERYTFNCVYKNPYIYSLAGRTYGEDNEAILSNCERYSFNEKKWTQIAPLNQARCSAMAFILKNKVFIFGGYKGNGERESSIEVYNEFTNIWNKYEILIEEGIEASAIEIISDNKVLVLGGRGASGDSNKAFLLEKNDTNDECRVVDMGNIGSPRCLHKSYRVKNSKLNDYIMIFGGNDLKSVECYSMKKKKIEPSDGALKSLVDEFRLELELYISDIKLKRYLMI